MSRYAQDKDARFRSGIRLLCGLVAVPVTFCLATLGIVGAGLLGLERGGVGGSVQGRLLQALVGVLAVTTLLLLVGLIWRMRWRWAASGAWSTALAATAILTALTFEWPAILTLGVGGTFVAGVCSWALARFDPPAPS
jgi:hypothetical protein